MARSDYGGQSQMEAVESSTTNAHWNPSINGFSRPTHNDNQNNMKPPFHLENGDLKLKHEKDMQ